MSSEGHNRNRPAPGGRSPGDDHGVDSGSNVHPADPLLIAYLDGELDDPAVAELEARLAEDAGLRKRLLEFQQTWDMLDEVTVNTTDNTFVKSTIEMVVTSAAGRRRRWHRWPARIAIGIAAFAIPALLGFQISRYYQNQPYRQFVAELQFWENADLYLAVDNMAFVEQLQQAGLFSEEIPDEP